MQQRYMHGYMQLRDTGHPWQFVVSGFDSTFSGQDGWCTVIRSDHTTERVRIDARDRINIAGRWYGRRNWMH